MLALLAATDVDDETLSDFAAKLAAHLEAEETILYPFIERTWPGLLRRQPEIHERLHALLRRASVPRMDAAVRRALVADVTAAFHDHQLLEQGAALPLLESMLAPATSEALGRTMRAFRSTILPHRRAAPPPFSTKPNGPSAADSAAPGARTRAGGARRKTPDS